MKERSAQQSLVQIHLYLPTAAKAEVLQTLSIGQLVGHSSH